MMDHIEKAVDNYLAMERDAARWRALESMLREGIAARLISTDGGVIDEALVYWVDKRVESLANC